MMAASPPITKAYIIAPVLADDKTINYLCVGIASQTTTHGEFRYSDKWLSATNAYPIDPENLPLSDKRYKVRNRKKLFGVLHDAGPDDWGERVMLQNHTSRPRNGIERLLRLSGTGVGELRFSMSRTKAKSRRPLYNEQHLKDLACFTSKILDKEQLSEEQLQILEPGSSMGGARPKTTVSVNGGGAQLVKFSRPSDLIDNPLLEYASMTLLAKAGINVPDCALTSLGEFGYAFSIDRFDRIPDKPIHFISAHSLFNSDKAREYPDGNLDPFSYMALARLLRRHSAEPMKDCAQLYRRMLANVLIGNTDDHSRNHAMIFDISNSKWRLSPAYDMLPIISSIECHQQSLSIGVDGRSSQIANALSCSEAFGLNKNEAVSILDDLHQSFLGWNSHFLSVGMAASDISLVACVIKKRLQDARHHL